MGLVSTVVLCHCHSLQVRLARLGGGGGGSGGNLFQPLVGLVSTVVLCHCHSPQVRLARLGGGGGRWEWRKPFPAIGGASVYSCIMPLSQSTGQTCTVGGGGGGGGSGGNLFQPLVGLVSTVVSCHCQLSFTGQTYTVEGGGGDQILFVLYTLSRVTNKVGVS